MSCSKTQTALLVVTGPSRQKLDWDIVYSTAPVCSIKVFSSKWAISAWNQFIERAT